MEEIYDTQKNITLNQNQIELFLATHGNKFSGQNVEVIKRDLPFVSKDMYQNLLSADFKDPTKMLLISLLGGMLGIDRFVLNDAALGVLKLLTCGGFYIWMIVDWVTIQDQTKEFNYKLLLEIVSERK